MEKGLITESRKALVTMTKKDLIAARILAMVLISAFGYLLCYMVELKIRVRS